MSKGRTTANDWLKLLYNATAMPDIAENDSSSPTTNIQVALHSAWPGETDTQDASELSYTGYARVAVARTTGGWTVTNDQVSPVANIDFGQRSDAGAAQTAMFFSTGKGSGGATQIFHRGVIGARMGPMTGAVSDTITIPGHTFANDDRVAFFATHGSSLPTGLTEGTVYYVINQATDTIQVSTTQGGGAVNITATGDGVAFKVTPLTVNQNTIPRLTTATVIYEE